MKTTTENKPSIRLLPEETIELLKQTLEEPPQSRMEESLYCAYIDGDLRQVSPRQIVWGENPEDEEEKNDTVCTPCVIILNGSRHIARLEREKESGKVLSLRVLENHWLRDVHRKFGEMKEDTSDFKENPWLDITN